MTKKHFEALAYALAQREPDETEGPEAQRQFHEMIEIVVTVCRRANPRFRSQQFEDACSREYWRDRPVPALLR